VKRTVNYKEEGAAGAAAFAVDNADWMAAAVDIVYTDWMEDIVMTY
jgi:hypothetical protein